MHWGKRGPSSLSGRRRGAFLPWSESLEDRRLLATLDLSTIQSASLGVETIGKATSNAAGYTVTDVGNVTGSGFDSFVVAATGITTPTTSPATFGPAESAVYLVFGSKQVNAANAVDFLTLTPAQRAADLAELGTLGTGGPTPGSGQTNPTVRQPNLPTPHIFGFNFDGLTLVTGLDTTTGLGRNSGLGFSVAALGDLNGSGFDDFAISAPNDAGGGKVFVIYGGTSLATQATTAKTIDLEPTPGNNATATPTKFVTFSLPTTGASPTNQVGYSVGGIGNFLTFGTTIKDLAIGVPGLNTNTGSVFTISSTLINSKGTGTNVDLSTIGVAGGGGIEYDGITPGDRTGSSVSSAGNFDVATTSSNARVDDLLIGAPGANGGAGRVYLVYGTQSFLQNNILGSTQSLTTLGQIPGTNPITFPLQGIVFNGATAGSRLGFSVASAGDYNGDGAGDIIIGAPGTGPGTTTGGVAGTGYAAIIYGLAATSTVSRINGIFTVSPNSTNPNFSALYYTGEFSGDAAGFSVSPVGDISGEGVNGVVIGAPGFSSNSGTAYVIPGNFNLTGTQSLASVTSSPTIAGSQLLVSNSFPGTSAFLGTSVSGRPLFGVTQTHTVDSDLIPDVIVGAPGYSLTDPQTGTTDARPQAGAGFYLSGANLGIGIPNNVILTNLGVGSNTPAGPYSIATTPNNLTLFVDSARAGANGTPAFAPFTDINPAVIKVNGVTFTNVTLSSAPDINGDGVPEASFVINRSLLGLNAGSTITFTASGKTKAGLAFVATSTVTITGGGGGGGGAGGVGVSSPTAATILVPPIFTGDLAGLPFPPVSTLEHLNSYQALPVQLAYQQFRPAPGFLARQNVFHRPEQRNQVHQFQAGTELNVAFIGHSAARVLRVHTLPHRVFTRSKFKLGETITFSHRVRVIPRSEQIQSFSS